MKPIKKLAMFLGMAKAVASVHNAGVVHGDITCNSFTDISLKKQEAKLYDFRYSGAPGDSWNDANFAFSPFPECQAKDCSLDKPLDVYMLALVFRDLVSSHLEMGDLALKIAAETNTAFEKPFELYPQVIARISKDHPDLDYPKITSDNLGKILEQCLAVNPAERPTANELVDRLNYLFSRAIRFDAEQLFMLTSTEDPTGNLEILFHRELYWTDYESAKNSGKEVKSQDKVTNLNQQSNSGQKEPASIFKYVVIGALALIAVAVPLGFYFFMKRSPEEYV